MALTPHHIPSPAFYGLAKGRQQSVMGPEWAVKAKNVVVDQSGRLASRKGWVKQNTNPIQSGAAIVQIHQFVDEDGTTDILTTTVDNIYKGTVVPSSIKGSLTITAGNWKFVNFNGYCLGWQAGHTPIRWTGSGNFATITVSDGGTLPDGNTVLAAFGRVWGLDDDKQTIRYSALLDHTAWATASGGGLIDMRQLWTRGMDEVMAIIAYGSSLVVFGKRHIVVWTDGSGSELGLSPLNMYVSTVIENVGLVARDAVALVGELDVVFWSSSGIRSLNRTVQEQATPINELSPENRDYLAQALQTGTLANIRMGYSAADGLLLISHPDFGSTFAFDMRQKLPDNGYRLTEWTMTPSGFCPTITDTLLMAFPGNIGLYSGYDDNDVSFQYELETGWIKVTGDTGRRQLLKALQAYMYTLASNTITFKWGVDFQPGFRTVQRTVGRSGDEWGIDEWNNMEWGSGRAFHKKRVPLSLECEYVKLAVVCQINGGQFAIQPLTLYTKSTRVA